MNLDGNTRGDFLNILKLGITERSYEVECLFSEKGRTVDRDAFTRVVSGLAALKLVPVVEPQRLDIRTEYIGRRGSDLRNTRYTVETLEGISEYCKSGDIEAAIAAGHATVMRKSIVRSATGISRLPLDIRDYRLRVNVKNEEPLDPDTDIVKSEVAGWKNKRKFFRSIARQSFTYKHWRVDCSMVQQTVITDTGPLLALDVVSSGVLSSPMRQEIEIEQLPDRDDGVAERSLDEMATNDLEDFAKLYAAIRRRIINNQFISSLSHEQNATTELARLTGIRSFPGPMPVTLEAEHLTTLLSAPGSYTVTEKADGERKLLLFMPGGDGQFIDRSRTVVAAGLKGPAHTLLDGEVVITKEGTTSQLVFDIYQHGGGSGGVVWNLPLVAPGTEKSRLSEAADAISKITPEHAIHSPRVVLKTFRQPKDLTKPIWASANEVLVNKDRFTYNIDGLVFTPVAAGVWEEPDRRAVDKFRAGTWRSVLKWKPVKDQTVDFLLRKAKATPAPAEDPVSGRYGEYSVFGLFVYDPMGGADLQKVLLDGGEVRETNKIVRFDPLSPRNTHAGVMRVMSDEDGLLKTENGELLEDEMIVECRQEIQGEPAGWGWRPLRSRPEKTTTQRLGRAAGTLNSVAAAESVWTQIHYPITETLIRTGKGVEEFVASVEDASAGGAKYQNRAMKREELGTQRLAEFHNRWIKRHTIFETFGRRGEEGAFVDVACGKGGDLQKYNGTGASFVLGVDVVPDNILNTKDGAIARYLQIRNNPGRRNTVPQCLFAVSDGASDFRSGAGAIDDVSRQTMRVLFGAPPGEHAPKMLQEHASVLKNGVMGMSCMFALHQFFETEEKAKRFFRNVASVLKPGGLFAATLFDGDAVQHALTTAGGSVERRTDDDRLVWRIEEVKGSAKGRFGNTIKVFVDSINTYQEEQTVPYDLLVETASSCGLRELTNTEASALGLPATTEMFRNTYARLSDRSRTLPVMTPAEQELSFLNRWVFLTK